MARGYVPCCREWLCCLRCCGLQSSGCGGVGVVCVVVTLSVFVVVWTLYRQALVALLCMAYWCCGCTCAGLLRVVVVGNLALLCSRAGCDFGSLKSHVCSSLFPVFRHVCLVLLVARWFESSHVVLDVFPLGCRRSVVLLGLFALVVTCSCGACYVC